MQEQKSEAVRNVRQENEHALKRKPLTSKRPLIQINNNDTNIVIIPAKEVAGCAVMTVKSGIDTEVAILPRETPYCFYYVKSVGHDQG